MDALTEGLRADLLVVSGGLGPTHDDRTVEVLGAVTGRALRVDGALEREIEGVARSVAARLGRPYADFEAGVRKQASLPQGARSLGLAGTAPALLLEHAETTVVVLPGPPAELQRLWPAALASDAVKRVTARAPAREHRVLRLFGPSESAVARVLDAAGGERDGIELTVCASQLEIQVDLYAPPGGRTAADRVEAALRAQLGDAVFATDERPLAELVLALCRTRGLTLATAESCTGGLVAARLTAIPGSSDVFRGAVVAYANEVKTGEVGVAADVLARHGAVSAETAAAMARGVRAALGADASIAVTGVAGPDGGTPEKPVGLVHLAASVPTGEAARELRLHGGRDEIRQRSATASLHLLRTLLAQNAHLPREPST
jgi:nicotinamide-nucleotide amidase